MTRALPGQAAPRPELATLDAISIGLDGTTLIEASAGTGKTFTITTLYVRLVAERGLMPSQILVVTYTRAATMELRGRLRERLQSALRCWAENRPDDPVLAPLGQRLAAQGKLDSACERLRQAIRSFDEAAVYTIHGFCQRVLQDHAFDSGAAFDAELLPDQSRLLREVIQDYWTLTFHEAPRLLVEHAQVQNLDLSTLEALANQLLRQPTARILPERVQAPDLQRLEMAWRDAVAKAHSIWAAERDRIAHLLLEHRKLNRRTYKPQTLEQHWFPELDARLAYPTPRAPNFLAKLTPGTLAARTNKGGTPPEHAFFDACEQWLEADTALCRGLDRALLAIRLDFARSFRRALAERKEQDGLLAYEDLLLGVEAALADAQGAQLARNVLARYPAALIDEFQDTDPVQYRIFERIYGGDAPLFLIGDPKQAIYGFRGADVFAYLQAKQRHVERLYTLDVNRRSDPGVVAAVGHLFGRLPQPFLYASIPYIQVKARPEATDVLAAHGERGLPLRCLFVPYSAAATPTDANAGADGKRASAAKGVRRLNKPIARRRVAEVVAADICEALQLPLHLQDRPVRPGDFAVLTRTNEQAARVQAELQALGVPSVLQSEKSVFETEDAEHFERLLAAMATPTRSGALRAALLTPLLGFDANALHALLQDEREWERWLDRFAAWHKAWVERGFMVALRQLLDAQQVRERLLRRRDGQRRLTNVLHLAELVQLEVATHHQGPRGVLEWLHAMRTDAAARKAAVGDIGQLRLETDERAVQLVTVHKSKGLQYPIVYCPFVWDSQQPSEDVALFHDPDADAATTLDLGSDRFTQNRGWQRVEALAEQLRLLYVALTRAQHQCCVVSGPFNGIEQSAWAFLIHASTAAPQSLQTLPDALADALKKASPEELEHALKTVADAHPAIGFAHATPRPVPRYTPAADGQADLQQPASPRVQRHPWHTTSFTALVEPANATFDEALERPHQAAEAARAAAEPGANNALAALPAGAETGLLLHEVLETIPMHAEHAAMAPHIEAALRKYGVDRGLGDAVATGLLQVLRTPLPAVSDASAAPFRLCDVAEARMRSEMEFFYPVGEAGDALPSAGAIAELFAEHGQHPALVGYSEALRGLGFTGLRGLMHGFVDLVFEHSGRWYLLDYKSNDLGAEGYGADAVDAAMREHHYILQYHLYLVALERFLRLRLASYRRETHLGGVYYVFLRGMAPELPIGTGVFADRPPAALLDGLSRLFGEPLGGGA